MIEQNYSKEESKNIFIDYLKKRDWVSIEKMIDENRISNQTCFKAKNLPDNFKENIKSLIEENFEENIKSFIEEKTFFYAESKKSGFDELFNLLYNEEDASVYQVSDIFLLSKQYNLLRKTAAQSKKLNAEWNTYEIEKGALSDVRKARFPFDFIQYNRKEFKEKIGLFLDQELNTGKTIEILENFGVAKDSKLENIIPGAIPLVPGLKIKKGVLEKITERIFSNRMFKEIKKTNISGEKKIFGCFFYLTRKEHDRFENKIINQLINLDMEKRQFFFNLMIDRSLLSISQLSEKLLSNNMSENFEFEEVGYQIYKYAESIFYGSNIGQGKSFPHYIIEKIQMKESKDKNYAVNKILDKNLTFYFEFKNSLAENSFCVNNAGQANFIADYTDNIDLSFVIENNRVFKTKNKSKVKKQSDLLLLINNKFKNIDIFQDILKKEDVENILKNPQIPSNFLSVVENRSIKDLNLESVGVKKRGPSL